MRRPLLPAARCRTCKLALLTICAVLAADRATAQSPVPLQQLEQACPRTAGDCTVERARQVARLATSLEDWMVAQQWDSERSPPATVLATMKRLAATKQQLDFRLAATLALRTQFVKLPAGASRRVALRNFLAIASRLIDLSGRIRYLLRDKIDTAAYDLEAEDREFGQLVDLLTEHRVGIGASVVSYALFDPAPGDGEPFSRAVKIKVLHLIAATYQHDMLPDLADFVTERTTPPDLKLAAAAVIRRVGLPQDPHPNQDESLPKPPITAARLQTELGRFKESDLPVAQRGRYREMRDFLRRRVARGVESDDYRVGTVTVRAGDWLLMRNPSPYNMFTDISPGLFTHVGVVTTVRDAGGVRRFVIADLPERGDRVPVTNVDTYLQRTLHYAFLRHERAQVAARMGQAAAEMIGNPTRFDLTFRTGRVEALRGKPLRGQLIHTYCAGFLLLCAQTTTAARTEFFPIAEFPAGGHCPANLKKLGLSIGDRFVSPTAALFSPQLKLVGRREPMYSPAREVKEAVYDHFGHRMVERRLTPSPDASQALRQKLAGLARYNPWLARALAKANNVSEHMDLEAAAKAAAAIETLDEIANRATDGFTSARSAIQAGPLSDPRNEPEIQGPARAQLARLQRLHGDLLAAWTAERLTPRQLRIRLVQYYRRQGQRELDERFFPAP